MTRAGLGQGGNHGDLVHRVILAQQFHRAQHAAALGAARGQIHRVARRAIARDVFGDCRRVAASSAGKSSPAAVKLSAAQAPAPPEMVTTAMRLPRAGGQVTKPAMMDRASSNSDATVMPWR